jgi:hypothetical protein
MQKEPNNTGQNAGAQTLSQKINEQIASLKYLESKKEINLQILNSRVKEINERNKKVENK